MSIEGIRSRARGLLRDLRTIEDECDAEYFKARGCIDSRFDYLFLSVELSRIGNDIADMLQRSHGVTKAQIEELNRNA